MVNNYFLNSSISRGSVLPHHSSIEIDLSQLEANINLIKQEVAPSLFCLPVKANAYGYGLIEVAKTACKAGVDYLAVAALKEAAMLRESGIRIPIILFGPVYPDQIEYLLHYDIECSVSSHLKARQIRTVCEKIKKRCTVHLEVDTGMQRTGMRPETALVVASYLLSEPWFHLKGIYSHFATSEVPNHPFAERQINLFFSSKRHRFFRREKSYGI
jgi:alanine racemase